MMRSVCCGSFAFVIEMPGGLIGPEVNQPQRARLRGGLHRMRKELVTPRVYPVEVVEEEDGRLTIAA